MTGLHISQSRWIPLDAFLTSTQAILAKKGSGKSYAASVEAEELLAAGQQIVVIDPTGAWHGLRSSADGTAPGFPIAVLGGDRGDVPLESTSGEVIADAIATEHFSAILDLSLLRKGEANRFVGVFLETLYRRNRDALHVFIDEADLFAPQRPFGDEAKTLGATEDVVRRGRIRGLGCTLITQRPQVLAKNVLSQVDMLTCLRMNHPKDLAAIKEWVDVHADLDQAKAMIASLPSLPIGEAWLWAPASDLFERVRIRARVTFDSGRTPKAGERAVAAKVLAPVDIARLGKAIAATHEEALARDPVALRKRIAELEAKLRAGDSATLDRLRSLLVPWDELRARFELLLASDPSIRVADIVNDSPQTGRQARTRAPSPAERATSAGSERRSRGVTAGETALPGTSLPAGEHKILRALLEYPRGLRRDQLTVLTGYKRSTRDSYIARLRDRGFVETNLVLVTATPAAIGVIPGAEPLPVGKALRALWLDRLPAGEAAVLGKLLDAYPRPVRRDVLDAATGFTRSTRDSYLSRLAARELIEIVGRGEVRASATLFEVQ